MTTQSAIRVTSEQASFTPYHKPAGGELLDWQKEFNATVNKIRYVIERSISQFQNVAMPAHRLPQTRTHLRYSVQRHPSAPFFQTAFRISRNQQKGSATKRHIQQGDQRLRRAGRASGPVLGQRGPHGSLVAGLHAVRPPHVRDQLDDGGLLPQAEPSAEQPKTTTPTRRHRAGHSLRLDTIGTTALLPLGAYR